MSSPCAKLVRCRVRNLASCFYACRFPLEEEASDRCRGASHDRNRSGKTCGEDVRGESVESSSQNNIGEPRFAEEDYIVFCFREDGAIHMITEPNSSSSSSSQPYHDHSPPSLRPTNRKLHYGECVGFTWDSNRGGMINLDDQKVSQTTEEEIPISHAKDDEKVSKEMENDDDEIKEISTVNEQHTNSSSKMDSFESCDSNLSDTSSSSFAFPVY